MSILDKIKKNVDYSPFFFKNVDFGQNLQTCRFSSNIYKNLDFGQNFKKYQFGRKSNLVKFVEKSRFWSKLSKILHFYCNLKKNLDFG